MAATLAALALSAAGQEYPSRPIRLIVPFAPGGTTDLAARLLGEGLRERLGQPVVVENRPGGGSVIGVETVGRAAPDGYTLLFGESGGMAVVPAIKKKAPYDPVRDFSAIGFVAHSPHALAINSKLPVRSLAGFIDYAKARPGKLNYGSSGPGSPSHMITGLFALQAHLDMVDVPFKGGSQALPALIAGEIDMMIIGPTGLTPFVEAGQLRVLAQTGRTRHPLLSSVPTMAELGTAVTIGREIDVTSWFGIFGPVGVGRPIVSSLNRQITAVLAQPAVQKRLIEVGCEVQTMSPEAFAQFVAAENRKWAQVITAVGINRVD
ncbi:MAG: tripartite tricarboxylate transporter substrate binding protein [Burkholderiales bacterium]|nr:tripartite tricarboxylate transporter substrate binding protein [Burkholderiales bacterium]